jgi:CelD/BcsL family acetyltransferase involved in cellulose biosynthesis
LPLTAAREELGALAPEWKALLADVHEPVVFIHPTWQQLWLDEFGDGREPLVLAVRDEDGTLAGVAPLMRQGEEVSLIGHYSICDYMDIVARPGAARETLAAAMDALGGEAWERMELRGLSENSETLAALGDVCRALGWSLEQEEETVAPRVTLPETWDAHVASLSKKDRHELRRKQRRLQSLGQLELRAYTSPQDVVERVPQLLRFMVESRSDKANFLTEQMGRFFHDMTRTMAGEGLVRLYELELDGQAVASVLCFDQGGQLYLYNSGYDPAYAQHAVGLVSKALCMQDALESGKHCVDFLRGREPYKYDLGAQDLTIYQCTIRRS